MNRWVRRILGGMHDWLPLTRIGREGAPTLVGIYGVPRGGTNFVAAQLHYHRELFCVSEHELDWRLPLSLYWKKRSVLREHGWQDKRREEIRRIVFNKVQRGGPIWSQQADFPPSSRFIFYFRNPIRCHLSRQAFLLKFKGHPFETDAEGFDSILRDFRGMIDTHRGLSARFPCLVLAHEYMCCHFDAAREQLRAFLDVADAWVESGKFFVRCGRCNTALSIDNDEDGRWLRCKACDRRVLGHGHFNPLREIDPDDIRSTAWKQHPGIEQQFAQFRRELGDGIADYYWQGVDRNYKWAQ